MQHFKGHGKIVKYTTLDGVTITAMLPIGIPRLHRVAAYCRVSTTHEEQQASLNAQLDYYKNYIHHQPGWVFAGAYADTKSGRNAENRVQFNRMIDDGLAGKFDIIITKTVSRFGRNTPDTLSILRKLKEHHIDVYFETENLHSCDGSNEFLISIIEAIAQAESENRSANVKWGIRRSADNPASPIYSRPCYGYRKAKNGDLEICTEEAEVVKMIFSLYLQGYSVVGIKKELEKRSIKTPTGKLVWPKRTIETMLGNEKYTGDVLVYKTYCDEYPSKKRIINKGQHSKLLVNDLHPVIIDKKTFEEVQNERTRRSNIRIDDTGIVNRAPTRYSMKKSKKL